MQKLPTGLGSSPNISQQSHPKPGVRPPESPCSEKQPYMQSCRRSSGEQVRAVRSDMARKVARVKAQAERVPRGMFLES